MNKRQMLAASVVTAFLTVAGTGIAAENGMMSPQTSSGALATEGKMSGGMMQGGMMGMKGMMENCPMMGGGMDALSPQQQMQMHAEMMRAMGQIMQKYASQAQPATK